MNALKDLKAEVKRARREYDDAAKAYHQAVRDEGYEAAQSYFKAANEAFAALMKAEGELTND
jgi:hypothetical protein